MYAEEIGTKSEIMVQIEIVNSNSTDWNRFPPTVRALKPGWVVDPRAEAVWDETFRSGDTVAPTHNELRQGDWRKTVDTYAENLEASLVKYEGAERELRGRKEQLDALVDEFEAAGSSVRVHSAQARAKTDAFGQLSDRGRLEGRYRIPIVYVGDADYWEKQNSALLNLTTKVPEGTTGVRPVPGVWYRIENKGHSQNGGMVIDLHDAPSGQGGNPILVYGRASGPNQWFRLKPAEGEWFRIQNKNGLYLDVHDAESGHSGLPVNAWAKGFDPNQLFRVEYDSDNWYRIQNRAGLYLDVEMGEQRLGAPVLVEGRKSNQFTKAFQLFRFVTQ